MRDLRSAAILVLLYAGLVLLNGLFYLWWSGDASELARMLVRIAGCGLVAYGIWTAARWGWWLGLAFTGVLSLFGAAGLVGAARGGLLEGRPYPGIELFVFACSGAALFLALILLLFPSSRGAVREVAGGRS